MSINFTAYGIKSSDMNAKDLEVGQTLIRIIRPRDEYSEYKVELYTVKKILKTRLVMEAVEPDVRGNKHELRLIVETSSWSIRTGAITTKREGDRDNYRAPEFEFATLDESALVDNLVQERKNQLAKRRAVNEARGTIREISAKINPSVVSLDEAIEALTALRDQIAETER